MELGHLLKQRAQWIHEFSIKLEIPFRLHSRHHSNASLYTCYYSHSRDSIPSAVVAFLLLLLLLHRNRPGLQGSGKHTYPLSCILGLPSLWSSYSCCICSVLFVNKIFEPWIAFPRPCNSTLPIALYFIAIVYDVAYTICCSRNLQRGIRVVVLAAAAAAGHCPMQLTFIHNKLPLI